MSEYPVRLKRWQPVVMVVNRRLECKCGALAVFITGILSEKNEEYNIMEQVDVWCQDCFDKAQEEEEA